MSLYCVYKLHDELFTQTEPTHLNIAKYHIVTLKEFCLPVGLEEGKMNGFLEKRNYVFSNK